MKLFKKATLTFLVLAIAACPILSGNATTSQAASYAYLEAVPREEAREEILEDIGISEKNLASDQKATDISEKLSDLIPAEVDDYAQQRASALIETVRKNPNDFGIAIEKKDHLQIETPFVIYSAQSLGKQDPIYYYPISNDGKIVLVLYVMECDGDYTAGISTDYAPELNQLDYQNNDDYIFYEDGETLHAANNDAEQNLGNMPQPDDDELSDKEEANAAVFEDLSPKNKVEAILNSYPEESNHDETSKQDAPIGARGFSTKNASAVRLNTSRCLVPQLWDGNCWAAAVATTVKYLNFSKYSTLSARGVCRKMKIGYNDGGTINDMHKALNKYGVTYKKPDYSQVSFATIQKNILAQRPLVIAAFTKHSGHAVTIIGYTTYGGINQITFHNPGTNTCTSVEYKKSGTTFSYNNDKFKWKSTTRCK